MHVWEITLFLEEEYVEVSDQETQEEYHKFINEVLYGHDTHHQVEQFDDRIVVSFIATTNDRLLDIKERYQQIFRNTPPREKPLRVEQRIYEY